MATINFDPNGKLPNALERAEDLSPAWPRCVEIAAARIDQNFDDQGSPDEGPWEPSNRAIQEQNLTLVKSGEMRGKGVNVTDEQPHDLGMANDSEQAVRLTEGTEQYPGRPFFRVDEQAVEDMAQAIVDEIFGGG